MHMGRILASLVLLLGGVCWGQASLVPDAPSTVTPTCTENSGKPCPEWVHKLVGQYPPAPDSPDATRVAQFFTFNTDSRATLKPDKKSWAIFTFTHVALAVTFAVDHKLTHGVRENSSSEIPAILGVTGLDFLAFKCISPSLSVEAPVYAIVHYARDATK